MAHAGRFFLVCIKNEGYEASLERRKIYVGVADDTAARHGFVRVFDESGEYYVYPSEFFALVDLPAPVRRAVLAAA